MQAWSKYAPEIALLQIEWRSLALQRPPTLDNLDLILDQRRLCAAL